MVCPSVSCEVSGRYLQAGIFVYVFPRGAWYLLITSFDASDSSTLALIC